MGMIQTPGHLQLGAQHVVQAVDWQSSDSTHCFFWHRVNNRGTIYDVQACKIRASNLICYENITTEKYDHMIVIDQDYDGLSMVMDSAFEHSKIQHINFQKL